MRATLSIIQFVFTLACIVPFFYGLSQFAEMEENFFDHFGRAAFSFLLVYGCFRIIRAAQKKIDSIDAVKNPGALTLRLMNEASERLGDLSHRDEKTARKMVEKELKWMEEQEREARARASSAKDS